METQLPVNMGISSPKKIMLDVILDTIRNQASKFNQFIDAIASLDLGYESKSVSKNQWVNDIFYR